jgi:serine/threonine protein kinase
MVMEYCENGSLQDYLRSNTLLPEHARDQIALDIALGLEYLASRGNGSSVSYSMLLFSVHRRSLLGIVHRDVAARNVLLSSEKRGKLADFGMSREAAADSTYYTSRGGVVPVR